LQQKKKKILKQTEPRKIHEKRHKIVLLREEKKRKNVSRMFPSSKLIWLRGKINKTQYVRRFGKVLEPESKRRMF